MFLYSRCYTKHIIRNMVDGNFEHVFLTQEDLGRTNQPRNAPRKQLYISPRDHLAPILHGVRTKFDFLNSDLKDNITTSHRSLSSAVCMRLTILEIGMMAHPLYCARYLANHARSALTARVTLMLSVVAARRAARRRQMFWRPERSWIDGWLDQSASACISLECMSCARLPPYKT